MVAKKGTAGTASASPKSKSSVESSVPTSAASGLAPRTSTLSPRLQKKVTKANLAARKQAGKTKVRLSRATRRADLSKPTKAGAAQSKTPSKTLARKPTIAQAPSSARMTPVRGPIAPLVSRTAFAPLENEERRWLVIDAANQNVGRLASEIANILRGKHKPTFTPNNDVGDFVVVINVEQIKFSAEYKEEAKQYFKHSGYIGGMKITTPRRLREKGQPDRILLHAVKGMVPRSPLGRRQMLKLKIYSGTQHPHTAQGPVAWKLRNGSNA